MPEGYWVSAHRTISDPEKLAAYNKPALAAVRAGVVGFLPVAAGSWRTTPESPSAPS